MKQKSRARPFPISHFPFPISHFLFHLQSDLSMSTREKHKKICFIPQDKNIFETFSASKRCIPRSEHHAAFHVFIRNIALRHPAVQNTHRPKFLHKCVSAKNTILYIGVYKNFIIELFALLCYDADMELTDVRFRNEFHRANLRLYI